MLAIVEIALDVFYVLIIFVMLIFVFGVEVYVNVVLSGWFLSCGSVGDSLVCFLIDALLRVIRRFEGFLDIVVVLII